LLYNLILFYLFIFDSYYFQKGVDIEGDSVSLFGKRRLVGRNRSSSISSASSSSSSVRGQEPIFQSSFAIPSPINTPNDQFEEDPQFETFVSDVVHSFSRWDHSKRNKFLAKLYRKFYAPQIHLISSLLELESGYPSNCRDILQWLPTELALKVLSNLDPLSLCRTAQVLFYFILF